MNKITTVGRFGSQVEAEQALEALERSGFDFKRLFMIRAEYAPGPGESRRHLRKFIVAGAIAGSLVGSWTGKVAVLALPLLALLGRGPAAERGLATLEDALVLGGLGALAAIVHHARLAQPRGDPNAQDGPIAPFRIELQGTPEEAARARTVLGGLRPQAAPA